MLKSTFKTFRKYTLPIVKEVSSFPCPSCKDLNEVSHAGRFCDKCLKKINFMSAPLCTTCGGTIDGVLEICEKCMSTDVPNWNRGISVFNMDGHGQTLIHRFKYQNNPELARPLGLMAADQLKISDIQPDFIVPTPLHWWRQYTRGFNQAELLSKIISKETNIPLKRVLVREKWTGQQAKMNRKQRKNNLIGAFSLKKQEICKNRTILLVDDVMTTGTTLRVATEALLNAGAHEVNILVLARR